MTSVLAFWRGLKLWKIIEHLLITARITPANFDELLLLAQLVNSDCGLNVCKVVLKTARHYLVIPVAVLAVPIPGVLGDSVEAKRLHVIEKIPAPRGHHSSFSSGEIFGGVEAECDRVAKSGADGNQTIVRSYCVRGVLHHEKAMPARKAPDFIHAARQTGKVHGNDRCRLGTYAGGDRMGIDIPIGSYIGENRSSTHMKNGVDGGAKCQGRRDDLISRPDIESRKRKMHCCRARACGQRVVGPHIGCELTLELCRAWTGC